ncbi:hypothetical protein LIER_10256 [Lithospermum erythrorhizon]|uniref:Retrovirus-related Pol polyprotein from transposon TNT 1-94 n=1 Tax=Lithospermum erythrorhizon TaxID=34254 RepID=A0AAV3PKB9_LITER
MKDLGSTRYILGMEIKRSRASKKLWLSQEKYIHKVLARFNMQDAKPVSCPLGTHFKLSTKLCSSRRGDMDDMEKVPYASAVGSLMYAMLCTRPDIAFSVSLEAILEGFMDSDMAGDVDTKKSTSGYLFTFVGGAISWQSKLQRCVELSTTEAEYIAIPDCCKQLLWLKRFFNEVGIAQDKFTILCDSQSVMYLIPASLPY